ncbi:MAG TPA: tetratricopeptide repeat protein [Actinomycetota bacterium]|nr:tetratricopeptide repeat protein [Actinomycetota bacterium]
MPPIRFGVVMTNSALPTGTVTFLFTDIEGSTRLVAGLGREWPPIVEAHNRILRDAVHDAGGVVVRTEGDAVFAVFSSAPAAVEAAVAGQRRLAEEAWPAPLRVRMGLHTGEGVAGGDDYVGLDVHRAARIAAAGHGGQVLISASTRALVENRLPDGVIQRPLGRHRLKDIARPEELTDLVIEGLPAEFPPPRTLDVPTNLPTPLTGFVGRGPEVERVLELLRGARLLTLTGPGGSGKTRLAIEAASRLVPSFPDGAFFVELAPITDAGLVPSTLARSVGVREEPGRPIRESLADALRDREALLLLDNFEQVLGAAPFVTDLLRGSPRLRILVTSRAALHVSGEQELPIPPLRTPDPANLRPGEPVSEFEAVQLFVQRGAAVAPGFVLTEANADAIAEICARLDGLPLAIELAASRVKFISPADMVARLQHRLSLLTGGAQDLPARQRALRETIRWSYDLLEPLEQRLFVRLSVFVGGWTLEAAEAVANPGSELGIDTLDGLGTLADNSLILIEPGRGEVRFVMLETIREFGTEGLAASGERVELRRRHVAFHRALAEQAAPALTDRDEGWLDRLEREHDNLRAAIRRSIETQDADSGLTMAWALWRFWLMRNHLAEGRASTEELLALPAAGQPSIARVRGLTALGSIVYWQRDPPSARTFYEESLALSRDLGDEPGTAEANYNLAFVRFLTGDPEAAQALLEDAAESFRDLGDEVNLAFAHVALGMLGYEMGGDRAYYRRLVEDALGTFRRRHQLWGIVQASSMVVALAKADGDVPRALSAALECLEANLVLAHAEGMSVSVQGIAILAVDDGRPELGARWGGAIERAREELDHEAPRPNLGIVTPWDAVESLLPAVRLEDLWAEGRSMSLDEAAAEARRWVIETMRRFDPDAGPEV